MSIVASELLLYGSLNMPTDDSTTAGGGIDTATRMIFDDATLANSVGPAPIAALSTSAGDTGGLTIYGRDAGGALVSDVITLAGTAPVTGSQTFDRVLMVSGSHAGILTVRKGAAPQTTLATMEVGVNVIRRPFYNVVADAAGGANKSFYEKVFLKNNNATLTLTSASVSGSSSGLNTITDIAIESGLGGTQSVANRLTAPTGVDSFSDANHAIGNLPATGTQAIWVKLDLTAGASPQLGTYNISILGNTT